MRHSFGMTPFYLMLSRHLPGMISVDRPSTPSKDVEHVAALCTLEAFLPHQITAMGENANRMLTAGQCQYKHNHNGYDHVKAASSMDNMSM